jgi:hypothetical protein
VSSEWKRLAEVGLYLCIFRSDSVDDEVDGVEVGSYDDFNTFRTTVAQVLERGRWASRFPVLMSHSDSDGEWSSAEATVLADELQVIEKEFAALPARTFVAASWQEEVARSQGLVPQTLRESFIDVDGEVLIARLRELAVTAAKLGAAISFQ